MAPGAGLLAIPQTFSAPSQFVLRTGKPAEEFFRDPAAWAPGAAIPGEASEKSGQNDAPVESPGSVFGINADAMRLTRGPSGELQETIVSYTAKAAGRTPEKLHDELEKNIAAFLRAKPVLTQGKLRIANGEMVVILPREPAPTLEVRISRPAATPPKAAAAH